ncbi:MAG TPA: CU044_2847 family protein [Pseudonocardiaceae bacterium]|nr:CU044_2847 family protein [Pseudonocardiaceae bacterium]
MTERRLVQAGGAEFYVEVSDTAGPTTIRDAGPLSFDGVRATVEGIATELAQVWQQVKPSEASVAFGLKLTVKSGKLTGLLVEGGGEGSLTVTLTWKPPG